MADAGLVRLPHIAPRREAQAVASLTRCPLSPVFAIFDVLHLLACLSVVSSVRCLPSDGNILLPGTRDALHPPWRFWALAPLPPPAAPSPTVECEPRTQHIQSPSTLCLASSSDQTSASTPSYFLTALHSGSMWNCRKVDCSKCGHAAQ